jgi:hypothetical protein
MAWSVLLDAIKDKISAVGRELKAATSLCMRVTLSNVILLLLQQRDVTQEIVDQVGEVERQVPLVGSTTIEPLTWLTQVMVGRSSCPLVPTTVVLEA